MLIPVAPKESSKVQTTRTITEVWQALQAIEAELRELPARFKDASDEDRKAKCDNLAEAVNNQSETLAALLAEGELDG